MVRPSLISGATQDSVFPSLIDKFVRFELEMKSDMVGLKFDDVTQRLPSQMFCFLHSCVSSKVVGELAIMELTIRHRETGDRQTEEHATNVFHTQY